MFKNAGHGACLPLNSAVDSKCMHAKLLQLFATLWTTAHQAPLSMDSSGKNTGVGCHALLQGIFPTQGLNLCLLSPALAGGFFTTSDTWEACRFHRYVLFWGPLFLHYIGYLFSLSSSCHNTHFTFWLFLMLLDFLA